MRKYDSAENYTPEQFENFIAILARTGRPIYAARAAGIPHSIIKSLAGRNPKFAERMAEARAEFVELLEEEAVRRAVEGDEVFVVSKGEVVTLKGQPLTEKRRSDRLLEFMLKGADPGKYREGLNVNVTSTGGVMIAPAELTPETWINRENDRLKELEKQEEKTLIDLGMTSDGEFAAKSDEG